MDDFLIYDVAFHLASSKNRRFRESVMNLYTTLTHFLQDNGLTIRELLKPGDPLPHDFKLMKSDLTEEGFQLIKSALEKWLTWVEGGGAISDVSILERELAKIRK